MIEDEINENIVILDKQGALELKLEPYDQGNEDWQGAEILYIAFESDDSGSGH